VIGGKETRKLTFHDWKEREVLVDDHYLQARSTVNKFTALFLWSLIFHCKESTTKTLRDPYVVDVCLFLFPFEFNA
jgi:hypothetical protein